MSKQKQISKPRSILQSLAIFWDGTKQLSGTLELWDTELVFHFEDFKHSNLNLCIKLEDIEYAKVFLLFNIARKGLKVSSKNDRIDMFILDDSKKFCEALLLQMRKIE